MKKTLLLFAAIIVAATSFGQLSVSRSVVYFDSCLSGGTSPVDSIQLRGSYLGSGRDTITIVADTSFEVSNSRTGSFSSSYSITYTGSTFGPAQIYARFRCTSATTGYIRIRARGYYDSIFVYGGSGCPGAPAPGVALAFPSTGDTSTVFSLLADGLSVPAYTNYQWQTSSDSVTWTNISGATNSTYSFRGISSNTYLRLVSTCFRSSASSASNMVLIRYANYCSPAPSSASTGCSSMGIYIRPLSLASGSGLYDTAYCNGTGYLDRTSLHTFVHRSDSFNVSIGTGTSTTGQCQAWIDFNDDGVFQTSESVGGSRRSYTRSGNFYIVIPATAPVGTHRMRVCHDAASGHSYPSFDPCMSGYTYGEARDYSITVTAIAPSFSFSRDTLDFGYVLGGTTSSPMSLSFSGTYLVPSTGIITITAPTNFQICFTSTGTYVSSLTVAYSGSALASTDVYVRFYSPYTSGTYGGCLSFSGGGIFTTNCVTLMAGSTTSFCSGTATSGSVAATPSRGDTATSFSIAASGFSTGTGTSYQWQSSPDSVTWTDISGATGTTYTFRGIATDRFFRLRTSCSYSSSTALSAGGAVRYYSPCSGTPSAGALSMTPTAGDTTTTFVLSATGATAGTGVSYQWQSSPDSATWSNISGATNTTYTFRGLSASTYYRLVVSCSFSSTSIAGSGRLATHTSPCSGTPTAGAASASVASCTGCSATFSLAGYSIAAGLTFQWETSTDSLSWSAVAGATNTTYTATITPPLWARCRVTCSLSSLSAYSTPAMVTYPFAISSTTTGYLLGGCYGKRFTFTPNAYNRNLSMRISYGDGAVDSMNIDTVSRNFVFDHIYPLSNDYSVVCVLYYRGVGVDFSAFSESYIGCGQRVIAAFYDRNSNGIRETSEPLMVPPFNVRVDSNGTTVDTIAAGAAFLYNLTGPTGTLYHFVPMHDTSVITITAPTTGYIADTVLSGRYYYPSYNLFGIACHDSVYDNSISSVRAIGSHTAEGTIFVSGYSFCGLTSVVLRYSPKFSYVSSDVDPAAYTAQEVVWNIPAGSARSSIHYTLHSSTMYSIGDTFNSNRYVGPLVNDPDTANNWDRSLDTIRDSYDPNYVQSNYPGCLDTSVRELIYTVGFENEGNDTAHYVYVMDTLSPYLDARSLRVLNSTHFLVLETWRAGGQNIAKFGFPNINLPDSSHKDLCQGTFQYFIKLNNGIPEGTDINARVGIYFDDNDVVLTDTWTNRKGCPPVNSVRSTANRGVHIYPNPAGDVLHIDITDGSYESCTITNSVGVVVGTHSLAPRRNTININALPTGIYYITLRGAGGVHVAKVMKE